MAFSFLEPSTLKDFVHDSDEYMKPFYAEMAEMERLSRGRPGRVPKGKPRVTDGTLAGVTRETPKRIIQQLPTGSVTVKGYPQIEELANAVLTDEILKNANSGGTPYSKSKKAVKDTIRNGAAVAYCFYNRRGDWFGADFRRVYVKDIGLEKGKVSEFDTNAMKMTGWYTKMDLKYIIYWQQKLAKAAKERGEDFYEQWDLKVLQDLLDNGFEEKDDDHKNEEEKKKSEGTSGFVKLEHCMQIGVGAKFYSYSPKLDKVAKTCVSKDPRGIIPVHFMVPEEDDSSPLGDPLISISAGKQNLLDFDMQMYQYSRGLLLSPPVKKWGEVPTSSVKLVPDAVIDMGVNKNSGTDIETIEINNSAINNFPANYGLIKSQILNELGATSDTSISASSGNPGFSKTDAGVNALQARLGVSDNDLRKCYESWFGRICETLLNLHFAHSVGIKELDLEKPTIKRLKADPQETQAIDYDKNYGKITFVVDASTSAAQDSKKENEDLIGLLEATSKAGGLRPDKQMIVINQIIKNSGVEDPEKLMYTDDEITKAQEQAMQPQTEQQPAPNESISFAYKDATPYTKASIEKAFGLPPDPAHEIAAKQYEMSLGAEQADLLNPETDAKGKPLPSTQPTPEQAIPPNEGNPVEGLDPDEVSFIEGLQQRGISDEDIATAITMLRQGSTDEEVMDVLGAAQNG